ncbi:acyl-CoA thioesterase [Maricaulis maris]|uniref:acyl-CoA thioesterase n=1 Tax=Maricaulis maris TaxID=74318 RepID=UPI003B8D16D3
MDDGQIGLTGIIDHKPLAPGEGMGCISYETALMRTITPKPDDFDELGHVNNVVYLRWVQEMAVTHWHLISPPDTVAGEVWVALKHTIEYRDPILPGETAEIRTWLGKVHGPRFDRHVDIRKPGAKRVSARATTEWCRIGRESRRPMRIGEDVMAAFGLVGAELE